MEEAIGFVIKLKDLATGPARVIAKSIWDIGAAITSVARKSLDAKKDFSSYFSQMAKAWQSKAAAFSTVSIALGETARNISAITAATVGNLVSLAMSGIQVAAETEKSNARLDFAISRIGKNAEETKKKIDEVALATSLTRNEVTDMVTSLALQRIDAFDDGLNNLFVTMQDGSQEATTALGVLDDAVAFSGKNSERIIRGMREAVSERKIQRGRWLADDLEIGGKELDKWNAALKKTKDPQEAFNVMIGLMAERVGGVTKSVANTLAFVVQQVGDWKDKLADELFSGALPVIAKFLRAVGADFLEMVKANYFESIREAITEVIEALVGFAKLLYNISKAILAFVKAHPWIIKVVSALGALMAAISGVAVALAGVMSPFLAFGALGAILPTILAGILPALGAMLVLFVALGAPITAVTLALGYLAAKFVGANGIYNLFTKWKILIVAVIEGLQNLEGTFTRLSTDTAAELEKHGVVNQFLDIMNTILKVKNGFIAFKDEILKGVPSMIEALRPMLTEIMHLGDTMDGTFGGAARDDMHSMDGIARNLAKAILWVTLRVLNLIDSFVTMFSVIARGMVRFGQMSNEEYAKVVGAPDAFLRLNKSDQDDMISGDFKTNSYWATREDGGMSKVPFEEMTREQMGPDMWAASRFFLDKDKGRNENFDAMKYSIMESIKGLDGGVPTSEGRPTSYAELGAAQQALVQELIQDQKVTKEEYKRLVDALPEALAKAIKAEPLKFVLNRETLATMTSDGSNMSMEDAN